MGAIRTLGLATAVAGQPTPVVLAAAYYTSSNLVTPGVVIQASSYVIKNGVATVVLASTLPTNGYNGPNGYPVQNKTTGSKLDIQGVYPSPNGQQVTLWGFTNATVFNGKRVSVIANNPKTNSFSFYIDSGDDSNTDTGNTAPSPFQHYRVIRLECSQSLGSDLIYVGDLNVSSSQYMACLSLTGQLAIEIASENIPPEGIFIDTNGSSETDQVMVTVVY